VIGGGLGVEKALGGDGGHGRGTVSIRDPARIGRWLPIFARAIT
jgi:hypothetical protein